MLLCVCLCVCEGERESSGVRANDATQIKPPGGRLWVPGLMFVPVWALRYADPDARSPRTCGVRVSRGAPCRRAPAPLLLLPLYSPPGSAAPHSVEDGGLRGAAG